jgi:hypothetical protein
MKSRHFLKNYNYQKYKFIVILESVAALWVASSNQSRGRPGGGLYKVYGTRGLGETLFTVLIFMENPRFETTVTED